MTSPTRRRKDRRKRQAEAIDAERQAESSNHWENPSRSDLLLIRQALKKHWSIPVDRRPRLILAIAKRLTDDNLRIVGSALWTALAMSAKRESGWRLLLQVPLNELESIEKEASHQRVLYATVPLRTK